MHKLVIGLWVALVALVLLVTLEIGLRVFMGFGHPILYDNSYTVGYRPLPNQDARRTGGKRVHINNLGLRASRDWPEARGSGEIRVLYLGDSVTWGGSYVDDRETFAEASADRLARALGRPVLPGNAGVNGWGPRNIAGLVQEHGFFGADVAVVVALEADLERELSHIGEMPFWNRKPSSAIEEVLSSWLAYKLERRRYLKKENFVPPAERDSFYAANIRLYVEIGEGARERGATPLMVWHPSRSAATGRGADPDREAFLRACRRAGLPTLDLLPVMRSQESPAGLYADELHLNVEGHILYGQALADALQRLLGPPV